MARRAWIVCCFLLVALSASVAAAEIGVRVTLVHNPNVIAPFRGMRFPLMLRLAAYGEFSSGPWSGSVSIGGPLARWAPSLKLDASYAITPRVDVDASFILSTSKGYSSIGLQLGATAAVIDQSVRVSVGGAPLAVSVLFHDGNSTTTVAAIPALFVEAGVSTARGTHIRERVGFSLTPWTSVMPLEYLPSELLWEHIGLAFWAATGVGWPTP